MRLSSLCKSCLTRIEPHIKIVCEGFGLNIEGMTPADIEQAQDFATATARRQHLFTGRELYFTPEDSPYDVVKIKPVLKSKSLSAFIDDNALPGFRSSDSKIFVVFETSHVTTDKPHRLSGGPLPEELEAVDTLMDDGWTHTDDVFDFIMQIRRDPMRYGYQVSPEDQAEDEQRANKLEQAYNIVTKTSQEHDVRYVQGKDPSRAYNIKLSEYRSKLLKPVESFSGDIAYRFAHQLKYPDQADMPITQKFIDLAASQITKMPNLPRDGYDYIIYPQSGSAFNDNLVSAVIDKLDEIGIPVRDVEQISKKTTQQVTISWDELYERAERQTKKGFNPKKGFPILAKGGTKYFKTAHDAAQFWADREHRKLEIELGRHKPDVPPEIKDIYADKRRHFKLFSPEGTEKLQDTSVLLIDDNVAGGGTIELIHEVVTNPSNYPDGHPPNRLDIFVPLRIRA